MTATATDNKMDGLAGSGVHHVPYWIYTDAEIYQREMERIFCGKSWNYVALAAEVPNPGDYKRSWVGDRPVVVSAIRTARSTFSSIDVRIAVYNSVSTITGTPKTLFVPIINGLMT